jgi:glycine cleavage system H protein
VNLQTSLDYRASQNVYSSIWADSRLVIGRISHMSTKYTEEQVWIRPDGEFATIGITHHAQDALGDIVFVDLPEIGKSISQKDVAGVVESVKTAADVYMPASGVVTEVNEDLRADPSLANTSPLENGWFFKVKLSDQTQLTALMDEAAYAKFEA